MKSLIEEIYYGNLSGEIDLRDLKKSEEFKSLMESYDCLEKSFSKEQMKLFEEWYDKDSDYSGLISELHFKKGFKIGMWLVFELIEFMENNL